MYIYILYILVSVVFLVTIGRVGRALHRYRRGHGFNSRTGLNFFQVLFTTNRFSSVLSCEDLLISSLHRSAIHEFSYI